MGDPAGVGPEVTVKALNSADLFAIARPLVIGDAGVLEEAARVSNAGAEIHPISDPSAGHYRAGTVDVLDLKNVDPAESGCGMLAASSGRAALEYIHRAMELTDSGQAAAIVTAPINKEADAL